jgi:hypothetical protein
MSSGEVFGGSGTGRRELSLERSEQPHMATHRPSTEAIRTTGGTTARRNSRKARIFATLPGQRGMVVRVALPAHAVLTLSAQSATPLTLSASVTRIDLCASENGGRRKATAQLKCGRDLLARHGWEVRKELREWFPGLQVMEQCVNRNSRSEESGSRRGCRGRCG